VRLRRASRALCGPLNADVRWRMRALLTLTILLLPTLATPCERSNRPPPVVELEQAYDQSDAVFAAEVLDRAPVEGFPRPAFRSTLHVVQVWKSDGLPLTSILSGQGGGDCSLRLNAGARYIVFAKRQGNANDDLYLDSVEPAEIPPILVTDGPTSRSEVLEQRYKLVLSVLEQKSK
jgi:hypothetical protein